MLDFEKNKEKKAILINFRQLFFLQILKKKIIFPLNVRKIFFRNLVHLFKGNFGYLEDINIENNTKENFTTNFP